MSYTQPYLRGQHEILADLRVDGYTAALGWSDVDVYGAINRALRTWQDRVRVARIYTISGGWVSGTYAYSLPNYIRAPYTPQAVRSYPQYYDPDITNSSSYTTWQDMPGWVDEPDSSGGLVLRLTMPLHTSSGRVIWYAPNSRIPTAIPVTNAEINSTATSVVLSSVVDCDDTGWVKIDGEWIEYSGVTRGTSTTTLSNLVRAQYGTTAATHTSGSSVYWGVAVDDMSLYEQLASQVKANLHQMMLVNTSVHETGRHERLMQFYQTEADKYWGRYQGNKPGLKMSLDRRYLIR